MSGVYVCRGCGMSFNVTTGGNLPAWCRECRAIRKSSIVRNRPRPEQRPATDIPVITYIALRLATYSAATRLALCHLQRHEYPQAAAVLIAAQDAA